MHSDGDDKRERYARDILASISEIRDFLRGYDYSKYLQDSQVQSAVERQIEKISEAVTRIFRFEDEQDLAETSRLRHRFPNVPWHEIRGIGNVLRHQYDDVNNTFIWKTVAGGDLPNLSRALQSAFPGLRLRKK